MEALSMSLMKDTEEGNILLLMGNEAIARGAIEGGVDVVTAYPGTPSSEIVETLARAAEDFDYYVEWSTNEKVAFEVAAGASLTGKRSLVAMKNAGLNVAMDTFMTLPYTGVKGGLVIVVADDPNAHYSSNEQDTRTAAIYAQIPCLEPSDQQEAKDMTKSAFKLSEELELPVFIRSVTRLSHASGNVKPGSICAAPPKKIGFNKHWKMPYRWNVYGPPGPVNKHRWLYQQNEKAKELLKNEKYTSIFIPDSAETGIIASGLGASYALEALNVLGINENIAFFKTGFINPLPESKITSFLRSLKKVIFIEEGDPVVEKQVRVLAQEEAPNVEIQGKMKDHIFDPCGELNVNIVEETLCKALEIKLNQDTEREDIKERLGALVIPRSSTLCAGCPHLGTYWALKKALLKFQGTHIINGDIGCYEQGGYGVFSSEIKGSPDDSEKYPIDSPYEILDTLYVMGSGIAMAIGQTQSEYTDGKILAVAGDSTFYHTVLPAVMDASYSNADLTFLVLDNSWTCMTGHQPNPNTGKSPTGEPAPRIEISGVVKAMGIENVHVVDPYDLQRSTDAIVKALEFEGPSVVILRRECALQVQRRNRLKKPLTTVDTEKCIGCSKCLELGCPAVIFDTPSHKAGIDKLLCVDCGLCSQICPVSAISGKEE